MYVVVGGMSVRVSVTVDLEVIVAVMVEVIGSLVDSSGGNMLEMVTHSDVMVVVVVKGHSVTVAMIAQTVESEGFTVTVLVIRSVTYTMETARRSRSAPGAAFSAANAMLPRQQSNVKSSFGSILLSVPLSQSCRDSGLASRQVWSQSEPFGRSSVLISSYR